MALLDELTALKTTLDTTISTQRILQPGASLDANPAVVSARQAIYKRKADAHRAALAGVAGLTWLTGTLRVTLREAPRVLADGRMVVWCTAQRSGVNINFPAGAQPFVFVNVPVVVGTTENPLGAAKAMIEAAVGRFG